MTKLKKLALHWKIIIGMALGVILPLLLLSTDWGREIVETKLINGKEVEFSRTKSFITDWIKPFGKIFINALKLIAIPLILASLITGITDLKDISKLSKMGGRTIVTYIVTTVCAVVIGLVLVNLIKPGSAITEDTRAELVSNYKHKLCNYSK